MQVVTRMEVKPDPVQWEKQLVKKLVLDIPDL